MAQLAVISDDTRRQPYSSAMAPRDSSMRADSVDRNVQDNIQVLCGMANDLMDSSILGGWVDKSQEN